MAGKKKLPGRGKPMEAAMMKGAPLPGPAPGPRPAFGSAEWRAMYGPKGKGKK